MHVSDFWLSCVNAIQHIKLEPRRENITEEHMRMHTHPMCLHAVNCFALDVSVHVQVRAFVCYECGYRQRSSCDDSASLDRRFPIYGRVALEHGSSYLP